MTDHDNKDISVMHLGKLCEVFLKAALGEFSKNRRFAKKLSKSLEPHDRKKLNTLAENYEQSLDSFIQTVTLRNLSLRYPKELKQGLGMSPEEELLDDKKIKDAYIKLSDDTMALSDHFVSCALKGNFTTIKKMTSWLQNADVHENTAKELADREWHNMAALCHHYYTNRLQPPS